MTVHVLIPVFNRLAMTRTMVDQLRSQILDEELIITVIDDGSKDGKAEFLSEQSDILKLSGDGSLWWGGGISLGLRHILPMARVKDWVIFVNNDIEIRPDFVQRLLDAARLHAPAAVGCVVRDIMPPHRLISVGPRVDPWRFVVEDVGERHQSADGMVAVDALSGRGVIYPVAALKAIRGMRSRWLPHYLADYELSLRVRAQGCRLLVATGAAVYSRREFGSSYRSKSLKEKLFSVRSPTYLPAQFSFWWQASGLLGRVTLPFRLVLHFIERQWGLR
jgi:GT2 family glycosyltransferase